MFLIQLVFQTSKNVFFGDREVPKGFFDGF